MTRDDGFEGPRAHGSADRPPKQPAGRKTAPRVVRQARALDAVVASEINNLGGAAAWQLSARGLAGLAVAYAAALTAVVVVNAVEGFDAASALRGALVTPWCAVPLIWIVRGKFPSAIVIAAVALPALQVAIFLPAYGYGVLYIPIAVASWGVAALLAVSGARRQRGRPSKRRSRS